MNKSRPETPADKEARIKAMTEGGKKLSSIKQMLPAFCQKTRSIKAIDQKVEELIRKSGAKPSFKMVPGYKWSTCINVNDSIVHGIPGNGYLEDGDLVTIDLGLFWEGYHVDSAISFVIGKGTKTVNDFLAVGKSVLADTIALAKPGNTVKDLSRSMQQGIESKGYNVVRQLTGHGVGRELHEEPPIPCFVSGEPEMKVVLEEGMTIAIEVMYVEGDWFLTTDSDRWTMRTKDGKLSAVVEETVLVTSQNPIALTAL